MGDKLPRNFGNCRYTPLYLLNGIQKVRHVYGVPPANHNEQLRFQVVFNTGASSPPQAPTWIATRRNEGVPSFLQQIFRAGLHPLLSRLFSHHSHLTTTTTTPPSSPSTPSKHHANDPVALHDGHPATAAAARFGLFELDERQAALLFYPFRGGEPLCHSHVDARHDRRALVGKLQRGGGGKIGGEQRG